MGSSKILNPIGAITGTSGVKKAIQYAVDPENITGKFGSGLSQDLGIMPGKSSGNSASGPGEHYPLPAVYAQKPGVSPYAATMASMNGGQGQPTNSYTQQAIDLLPRYQMPTVGVPNQNPNVGGPNVGGPNLGKGGQGRYGVGFGDILRRISLDQRAGGNIGPYSPPRTNHMNQPNRPWGPGR